MKPITDRVKHVALFFNDDGHFVGQCRIPFYSKNFTFRDGLYNFKPKFATFFKLRFWFHSKKYYLYNIYNPDPYILTDSPRPLLNTRDYKQLFESQLVKQLNEVGRTNVLSLLLQPKVIFPILVILAVIYYFSNGGSIL